MIRLFLLLAALLLSVIGALWFNHQGGYVMVNVGQTTLETSLFLAVAVTVVAALLGYFLLRTLIRLVRTPDSVRQWWRRRRLGGARDRLVRGLLRIMEGRYADAERSLARSAPKSDVPLLHYLCAAFAAHGLGATARRDDYLAKADRSDSQARLAVGLVQARFSLEDEQWETAFASLTYLNDKWPRQAQVRELLARVCEPLGEWDRLLALLPALRREGRMDEATLARLERTAAIGSLRNAARQDESALTKAWNSLPRSANNDREVALCYVDCRMQFSTADAEAERILRQGLHREWGSEWVDRYGRLELADASAPLRQVESWLKQRPEDAALLLAAGRLAISNGLWGRARSYLEAAVSREPSGEACYLLGSMQERLGETDKALTSYRRASELGAAFHPPAGLRQLRKPLPNMAEG